MGIELVLSTFEDESAESDPAAMLNPIADALRVSFRKLEEPDDAIKVLADRIMVDLPGGTAAIHPHHAIFPIVELDPLTLRVVFDVAKAGDMAIVTEGGDYCAIVATPAQRKRLPSKEWRTAAAAPLCRSPKTLGRFLDSWFHAHSEFKKRVVADWTAKDVSTSQAESSEPDEVAYTWDPWADEYMPNGPEPESVWLYRFHPDGNQSGAHSEVLGKLRDVCQRHIKAKNMPDARSIEDEGWPPIKLETRFYSAEIWPFRVDFTFYEWTDSVAGFMFDIARTGDMIVIVPGALIVTDPAQEVRLPQAWKRRRKIVPCTSARELKAQLRRLLLEIPKDKRDYKPDHPLGRVPGTYLDRAMVIYVEAKPKEKAAIHQEKVYGHEPQAPDGSSEPEDGLLMSEFWHLKTPTGQRFYAYSYGGVGWPELLRDFARSEDRAVGEIVNFETFVQDDGKRFALEECKVQKVEA